MSANEQSGTQDRKKKGGQEKKAGKPSGAGKRAVKFPRYHDNTRLHKAVRMLRSNGFVEAVRVVGTGPVKEVIQRAKKTSPNFHKWCERRRVPPQYR